MNDQNIQIVVNNELCFGCGTCNVACPTRAIHMNFGSMGRLLPVVDNNICTHCGLCVKVCPGIDISGTFAGKLDSSLMGRTLNLFVGRSADEEIFSNAQSGGAVTETLAYLFDAALIDAALVVGQDNHTAKYYVAECKHELLDSQTSQYTPVDLVSGLLLVKDYEHVAIVGLPCHIEGIVKIKNQFPNRYANIEYLFGLICAGTQSQLIVDVVKNVAKKRIGTIADNEQIKWRQKKYSNYKRADIAIVGNDGNVRMMDSSIRHTTKQYLTAPRCKLCFDKMNLYADVVYGDAWGVSGENSQNGNNVIICRTEKGLNLISEMVSKERLVVKPCDVDEIAEGQGMVQKKFIVENMLAIYGQNSFLIPGWSRSESLTSITTPSSNLKQNVCDYLIRCKKASSMTTSEVSSMINRKLLYIEIKRYIKNFLKLGK